MIFGKYSQVYFLGIGGIGMSAIARYFNISGATVSGYDKTPSELTKSLQEEGISVTFDESVESIPNSVIQNPEQTLFILTPAIPADHPQLQFIQSKGWPLFKRSEVLGMISSNSFCIAVAGTHGKTTTSTMIAHLLNECGVNFTAFLGGISSNFNSNYFQKTDGINLFENKPVVVLEADEFDRSFHRLNPEIAIITAIDPDHLDIYQTEELFYEAFEIFAQKINKNGYLITNALLEKYNWPNDIQHLTYCLDTELLPNFQSHFIAIENGDFKFDYTGVHKVNGNPESYNLTNLHCGLPGFHNIENATAAIAVCLDILKLDETFVRKGLASFKGAKRRFEYVIKTADYVVIDDYAHHPEELNAIISSVRELYPNKKMTGIFQPHLFSRTRDFSEEFAESLSSVDELLLMEIYPAREKPIEGIHSAWLLEKINLEKKQLATAEQVCQFVKENKPELLLIMGAGDIDRIVTPIKEIYESR